MELECFNFEYMLPASPKKVNRRPKLNGMGTDMIMQPFEWVREKTASILEPFISNKLGKEAGTARHLAWLETAEELIVQSWDFIGGEVLVLLNIVRVLHGQRDNST